MFQFLSILGLAVFAIISFRKLEWGIYAVVLTLPCYLLRLKIFSIPTTVLELEIYILFFVFILEAILDKEQGKICLKKIKLFVVNNWPLVVAASLILLGAILSTIFSSNFRVSAGILKGWFFDPLLFSIILVLSIKTKKQAENIFSALAISGIGVAIISLFYYFSGNLTFDGRLKAFFLSPNHLAMYLAPCLLFAIYNLQLKNKKLLKCLWLIGAILIWIALYFTYSYSAWFGVFLAILFLNIFLFSGEKRVLGFFLILLFIFLLLYFQSGSPKLQNLVESPRSSLHSRLMVWSAAFEIIKDNPVFGIGPGMFQEYYLDYQKYFPPYLEWAVPQPHSIFLAFWLQTGFFGLVGFIWLVVWFFKTGVKSSLKIGNCKLKICLIAIMVYILAHGLLDTTYWKNDLSVIFWLVISLMILITNTSESLADIS